MGMIQVLDKQTINKIAAGEVIENPAAVVKELVENSIDAESSSITVEIKDGGTTLIRVTDNGRGIEKEDVKLAFLSHATSKIRVAEDLFHVNSLGFRGEALPSIASVSIVEVLTKTADSLVGTMLALNGGEEEEWKEIGVPEGTTIVVKELFHHTPARKKFLKSVATEGRYVLEVMEHLALSHPHIAFKFIANGQVKFQTAGNGNLKDVLFYMYGKEITSDLLPLSSFSPKEGYEIQGFIGRPSLTRGNREYENYFINGRYIKSKVITKAIEEAYKPFLMNGRFPFTCLLLILRNESIDVNVHPTKLEVRFSDPEEIFRLVYHAVSETLNGRELIPNASLESKSEKAPLIKNQKKDKYIIPYVPKPEPFEIQREREWQKEIKPLFRQESFLEERTVYEPKQEKNTIENSSTTEEKNGYSSVSSLKNGEAENMDTQQMLPSESFEEPFNAEKDEKEQGIEVEKKETILLTPKLLPDIKLIGQVFGTYWIIQYGNKVYMIDQHAAHEKVMFERFLKRLKEEKVLSQTLFPPVLVRLSAAQSDAYVALQEQIAKMGFEVEEFGGNEYAIKAVPTDLFGLSEKDALTEILDGYNPAKKRDYSENTLDKLATRACKAAVKGNNRLTEAEVLSLIKDLMTLDHPYHCPHGRPTMIFMSKSDIEKKFKRQL